MEERIETIKWTLKKYNQEHLLNHFENLTDNKKEELVIQLENIDFDLIKSLYENTKKELKAQEAKIEPS